MKKLLPLILFFILIMSVVSCSISGHDLTGIYKSADGTYTFVCKNDGTCSIRHVADHAEFAYVGTYDKEGEEYVLTLDTGLGMKEIYRAKKTKYGVFISGSEFYINFIKQ